MVLAKLTASHLPYDKIQGLVAKLQSEILMRLKPLTLPRYIILFGSAASLQMTAYSDLDVVVVVQSNEEIRPCAKLLSGISAWLDWPVDLIIVDFDQFLKKRDRGGVFWDAWHDGKILFQEGAA